LFARKRKETAECLTPVRTSRYIRRHHTFNLHPMIRIAKFVVSHPRSIIVITLLLTTIMAAVLVARGVSFDGSPQTLARNDEALAFFDQSRKTFGDDRVVIVALETSDVFAPDFLKGLDRLTRRLGALDGVDEAQSLTTVNAIRGERGDIRVEPLIDRGLLESAPAAELQQLKQQVTADPLYVRQFVSTDGQTAAINLFLRPTDERQKHTIVEQVEKTAVSETFASRTMLAGIPLIEVRGENNMIRDFGVLSPVAAILCFLIFLVSFRTFWGAALPMAALMFGLIWTIGLMSLIGKPITLTTLAIPTVLMAVGGSYMFHVLNQYRVSMSAPAFDANTAGKNIAWIEGLTFIGPAVIVSGTATIAGFGALASSNVPTVRDMGIFDALGVFAMLVLTVAFVPAVLSVLPAHALGKVHIRSDYAVWMNLLLHHLTAVILFRKRAVLTISLLLTVVVGAGVAWLRVNTDYLRIFPRQSQTVRDAEEIHKRLAGVVTVQLVVSSTPDEKGTRTLVSSPRFLDALSAAEQFALKQPGVDSAISVADIVNRIRQVSGTQAVRPGDAAGGAQFDPFQLLSEDESVYRLISRDLSRASIVLRTNLTGSNELRELTTRISDWSAKNLPSGLFLRATGSAVLLNEASDAVAYSQTTSLTLAVTTIFLMMAVLFRSLATGLLALIPNLLPIATFFGFLGWMGITLDITTSLIASAVLGLAVDNAVHMIRRYRQSLGERGKDPEEREGWAIWLTLIRSGKPMVLANLMLIVAFLIFRLSSFEPVRVGGALWALTIFECLIANLVFLPALMITRAFSSAARGRAAAQ